MKQTPSTPLECLALILLCCAISLINQAIAQTAAPAIQSDCNHLTQLKSGTPGSPTNLIKLPNRDPGVSELAALMRNIYDALVLQQTALKTGKALPKLTDFTRASCTHPTDTGTRTPQFDAFAQLMNATLTKHAQTQTKTSYNGVIGTCLACHQHYCPGPVGAIRDLLLTQSDASKPQASESCSE